MKNFDAVAKLPGIVGAALSNDSGSLLEFVGNIDGDTVGAVNAFSVQSLGKAGEVLGLGSLERIIVSDPGRSCIALVLGDEVLSVYADAGRPFANLEKKLDTIFTR
jgi:predicted regulator of Ras-like GTPase activity (Roadblock/LC7/MglB family)